MDISEIINKVLIHFDSPGSKGQRPLKQLIFASNLTYPKLCQTLFDRGINIRPETLRILCTDDLIKIGLGGGKIDKPRSEKLIRLLSELLIPEHMLDANDLKAGFIQIYSEKLEAALQQSAEIISTRSKKPSHAVAGIRETTKTTKNRKAVANKVHLEAINDGKLILGSGSTLKHLCDKSGHNKTNLVAKLKENGLDIPANILTRMIDEGCVIIYKRVAGKVTIDEEASAGATEVFAKVLIHELYGSDRRIVQAAFKNANAMTRKDMCDKKTKKADNTNDEDREYLDMLARIEARNATKENHVQKITERKLIRPAESRGL